MSYKPLLWNKVWWSLTCWRPWLHCLYVIFHCVCLHTARDDPQAVYTKPPILGCFGYFHPFLPYRHPFLPLSTRFTTVNIYCQLSSVAITYPKINYTSLTHFSPFSLILTHLTHFSIVFLRVFARPHASLTHYIRIWHITFISAHPSPFSTSFTRKQPFPVIFGPEARVFCPMAHVWHLFPTIDTPTVDRSRLLPRVSSPTIHFLPIFVHFSLTSIFNTIYSFFNPFFTCSHERSRVFSLQHTLPIVLGFMTHVRPIPNWFYVFFDHFNHF